MWNRQSSVPTVSGETQDGQLLHRDQHRTFPHFLSDHTPLLVRPQAHSSRGHLRWPHDPLQVTQQAVVQPYSEQSTLPSPRAWSQSQKWRLRALVLNAGSRSESSEACAHFWGEATHKNLRSVSDGGGVQNMPRQNASWSHVKPALSTSEGLRSGHLPLSSFPALLRLTRRVMCTYSIHHVITWHVYTVKYLSQSTNQHIHHLQIPMLCMVTTLTMYSPDKFPACSNRIGLTMFSELHTLPQDAFILQLKVCTSRPTSPQPTHLPAPDNHHPTVCY